MNNNNNNNNNNHDLIVNCMEILQEWNGSALVCMEQRNWQDAEQQLRAALQVARHTYSRLEQKQEEQPQHQAQCPCPRTTCQRRFTVRFHAVAACSPIQAHDLLVDGSSGDCRRPAPATTTTTRTSRHKLREEVHLFPLPFAFTFVPEEEEEQQQQQQQQQQPANGDNNSNCCSCSWLHHHQRTVECLTACCMYNLALTLHAQFALQYVCDEAVLPRALKLYELAVTLLQHHVNPCDSSLLVFLALCDNATAVARHQCLWEQAQCWKQSLQQCLVYLCPPCRWDAEAAAVVEYFELTAHLPEEARPPAPAA